MTENLLAYLHELQAAAAVTLFVVCAGLVWIQREHLQRRPLAGYVTGLLLVVVGVFFDAKAEGARVASTVFTAGIIGLGVSIVASSLSTKKEIHRGSGPESSHPDDLVKLLSEQIEAAKQGMVQLSERSMPPMHREMLLRRERRRLVELLLLKRDIMRRLGGPGTSY